MIDIKNLKEITKAIQQRDMPLSLTVSDIRASFGVAVIRQLGYPRYAKILVNPETKTVVLFGCAKETENSFPFAKDENVKYAHVVRKDVCQTLDELASHINTHPYTVIGQVDQISDNNVCIVFDMTTARKKK